MGRMALSSTGISDAELALEAAVSKGGIDAVQDAIEEARLAGVAPTSPLLRKAMALLAAIESGARDSGSPQISETHQLRTQMDAIFSEGYTLPGDVFENDES